MKLIVKVPFGAYRRGDEITDAIQIAAALASNPGHVVRAASGASASLAPLTSAPEVAHAAD